MTDNGNVDLRRKGDCHDHSLQGGITLTHREPRTLPRAIHVSILEKPCLILYY